MAEDGKKEDVQSKSTKKDPDSDVIAQQQKIWEYDWMLRPCEMYKDEYNDCKSIQGRFHQHFVYGESLDCSQWKIDAENCKKWRGQADEKAYKALVESEQKRRLERLRPHYENDVWTKRDKPPSDWNDPLPEWMNERNKNTFLGEKQKEIDSGTVNDTILYPACVIL